MIQMACTHSAAMAVLSRLGGGHGPGRSVAAMASAAARLLRAYATQIEALRSGGSQLVRVEHVHVNEGGQAVIGRRCCRSDTARGMRRYGFVGCSKSAQAADSQEKAPPSGADDHRQWLSPGYAEQGPGRADPNHQRLKNYRPLNLGRELRHARSAQHRRSSGATRRQITARLKELDYPHPN